MSHKWVTAPARRRMASRFVQALSDVTSGTIRRGPDFMYRRNHGMGRDCDTTMYILEQRGMVVLHRNGTVSLTSLGQTVLFDQRGEIKEEENADHS